MQRRTRTIGSLVTLGLAVGASLGLLAAFGTNGPHDTAARAQPSPPPFGTGMRVLRQRFSYLSRRHSNECSLRPQDVNTIAVNGRLQGSCCTPMALGHYMRQVRALTAFRRVPEIPRDPYDIAVSQAKRLLGYDRSITLTTRQ